MEREGEIKLTKRQGKNRESNKTKMIMNINAR